jgi:uncharacterized protein YhjY with autotransporter beta-barrel domain
LHLALLGAMSMAAPPAHAQATSAGLNVSNWNPISVSSPDSNNYIFGIWQYQAGDSGSSGGDSSGIAITNGAAITLSSNSVALNGAGIWAADIGGNAGSPSKPSYGGSGGSSAGVQIYNNSLITESLSTTQGLTGIQAMSEGGNGGGWGAGGNGGWAYVSSYGAIRVSPNWSNATVNGGVWGILSQSTGGQGGSTDTGSSKNNGGAGGNGGQATVNLDIYGDVYVTATGTPPYSSSTNNAAVAAISLGGAGGNAAQGNNNSGGGGGSAGLTQITHVDSMMSATGDYLPAFLAYGAGGDGGNGGTPASQIGSQNPSQNGGSGGGTAGASISLGAATRWVYINTAGSSNSSAGHSPTVASVQTGGNGGYGGYSQDTGFSTSHGGNGGSGGTAGPTNITIAGSDSTWTNVELTTAGNASPGIYATSQGGAGGYGGAAWTALPGSADGGNGGAGGSGGDINITLNRTDITTGHSDSPGIIARTEGGLGAAGGFANGGPGTAYGGNGGAGGNSGNITITTSSSSSITTTYGSNSEGILAQSLSAGGGNAGGFNAAITGTGGTPGTGGAVGTITITNGATISTAGPTSRGILAQAMAGTGGDGGSSWSIFHSGASTGGSAGASGAIVITNSGSVTTAGDNSEGILMQSIGGGGGAGGQASGVIANLGGGGGAATAGGSISFTNSGSVTTSGQGAIGVLGQSIGGSGGDAGGASGIAITVGGTGGSAALVGGSINATLTSGSSITTTGDGAHGAVFQSIGGGGGNGGNAVSDGVGLAIGVGGTGGAGGGGGAVTVAATSATISAAGNKSTGLLAQSIGGGGGTGGSGYATSLGPGADISVAVGGRGGSASSDAGTVSVTMAGGSIATGQDAHLIVGSSAPGSCLGASSSTSSCNVLPVDSHGVVVQSVGGGGGKGGQATAEAFALALPDSDGNQLAFALAVGAGGSGGAGGNGGIAQFFLSNGGTITTSGNGGVGALVQSIGGGGGDGGDSSAMAADLGYTTEGVPKGGYSNGTSVTATVGGSGGSAGNGGTVQVAIGGTNTSTCDCNGTQTFIQTFGDYAPGVLAQSVGGGGGNAGTGAGNTQEFGMGTNSVLTIGVGSQGSPGGTGGDVTVNLYPGAGITTWGSAAVGIIAQSIGGGGGTSQGGSFGIAQSFKSASGTSPAIKPGMNVNLGNRASSPGGDGGSVTVLVSAPITTHGNDATGVLAQSIGGGGGLGGSSGSDGSGDNPVISSLFGREFESDVVNYIKDNSLPQVNTSLDVSIGGAGGQGGQGGDVTVSLSSQIQTLGNAVVQGGNQQESTGDWAHGLVAQSIGGGGGKGGTAMTSGAGDPAEVDTSIGVAVGGAGGSGGDGGTVTVNFNPGAGVKTVGYGATAVVAQSIGGGGGMGADGSDSGSGTMSVGGGGGKSGGSGGNGGSVTFQNASGSSGQISTGGIFADGINLQSIGGGGGIAGAGASVWGKLGAPQTSANMQLTAGGGSAASGAGGAVQVNPTESNPMSINVSGYGAYGLVAQSIGGGGGILIANQSGTGAPTILLGGTTNSASATGGPVTVNLSWDTTINASGTAGIGLLAQSVGGGGGIIRVNDNNNSTPSLSTAYNPALVNQSSPGAANGGSVNVTSYGTITANGPGGIGIFAQSVGGGGGLILNGSTLYAGAPLQQQRNCTTTACGGISATDNNLVVSVLANSVSATGPNGIGIFAQAAGYGPTGSDAPTVWVGNGNPSNLVTVTGGSGSGAGVWIDRPNGISGWNSGKVTVQEGGTLTTSVGSAGMAAMVTGGGSLILYNLGTLVGSTVLDTADVVAGPEAWDPGPYASSGVLQSSRGSFLNSGVWVPGVQARGNVLNQGLIAFDNPAMTTRMNGHFIQSAGGRLSPMIDSLSGNASLFQVDGSASVDGLLVPNAITLLPGTVTVFTAGSLDTTAQAQDSLIFDWDARRSNSTITLTPAHADFTPTNVSLSPSRSSLANYWGRAWNNADPTIAGVFGSLSHINDAGEYKDALDRFSSKGTQAQTVALVNSAGTILGSSMSCPVFEGTGVVLDEDNCVWGQVNGRWADQQTTGDTQGYHVSGTTYRVGVQRRISPNWYLGASAAAGQTYARAKNGSSGSGDVYDGSITLKRVDGPWYLAGSLAMASGSFQSNRKVNAFGTSEQLDSKPDVFLAGARLRGGYEFAQETWYVRPYGDLDFIYTHMPSFKESGAPGYALNVRSNDQFNVALSPMIEFGRRFDVDAKSTLRAYAAIGFSYRPDSSYTLNSSFVGADAGSGTFTDYVKTPEVLGKVDVGVQLFRQGGFEFKAGYTADFSHSFVSQGASARFAYHF